MPTSHPRVRLDPIKPGQKYLCLTCGSEIQVIIPSLAPQPHQVFQCCGLDMVPNNTSTTKVDIEVIPD